ncbi:hypothetical protein HBA54_19230 [Pelagibius litoralis]|uniref:Uncharacterized protein n=1 Tax=Pelagibius litoralis TaxID=374515 RepID=A0A967F0B0_9PROT|nr:hypothetical protein [Pelagibius litoralis]NIA70736.1 hypothetical protein [Pelagibius litoralis]
MGTSLFWFSFLITTAVYGIGVAMGWWARGRAEKNMRQHQQERPNE